MDEKIISACVAFILAFFVVNGIMFAYERPVAWIDTPNGASRAVRNPNAMLIHGTEGYSISKIDSYGFTNQNYALADEYILMMGASHSQGKEITISRISRKNSKRSSVIVLPPFALLIM